MLEEDFVNYEKTYTTRRVNIYDVTIIIFNLL